MPQKVRLYGLRNGPDGPEGFYGYECLCNWRRAGGIVRSNIVSKGRRKNRCRRRKYDSRPEVMNNVGLSGSFLPLQNALYEGI